MRAQRAFFTYVVLASVLFTCLTSRGQVTRGYTGTQVFVNCSNPDEQQICGVLGAKEVWVSYVPEESGVLYLNTDGSTFDTVMGAFVRSSANPALLQLVICDNNSGSNGLTSAVHLQVRAGETNFVLLAGVNGDCGTLVFNYSLVSSSRLTALSRTPSGQFQGRVTGHAGMKFTIQVSSNLVAWNTLLTTNSVNATLDFVDRTSPIPSTRFYRALMLP